MKDEAVGMVIKNIIALCSKMYSYSTDPTKLFSKIKELTEDTIDHDIVSGTLRIFFPRIKKPRRKVYLYPGSPLAYFLFGPRYEPN